MKACRLIVLLSLLPICIAARNSVEIGIKTSDKSLKNMVTLLALHLQNSTDYADQLLYHACQEYSRLKEIAPAIPSNATTPLESQTHKYLAVFLKLKESDPDAALRFAIAIAQRLQHSTDSNDRQVLQTLCDYIRLRYYTEETSENSTDAAANQSSEHSEECPLS